MVSDKRTIILTKAYQERWADKKKPQESEVYIIENSRLINTLMNMQNKKQVTVYDITHRVGDRPQQIYNITGHVNQTGENFLINKQKKLNIDFIGLENLYSKNKENKKIITNSLGNNYEQLKNRYKFPSTQICNIAILCRALGYKKIIGKLVNSL